MEYVYIGIMKDTYMGSSVTVHMHKERVIQPGASE